MKGPKARAPRTWLVFAASCGFLAGMLVMASLVTIFPEETRPALASAERAGSPPAPVEDRRATPIDVRPSPAEEPAPVAPPPVSQAVAVAVIEANPLEDLRKRVLNVPIKGAARQDIKDSFTELRGGSRRHEAIDLLAPRHTPVVAVEDGTIARLFYSEAGGTTVYQFDPAKTYVYYYAHLERYADGIVEGAVVKRGQVLGYVGTSGNAPKDTPHLHFAIFKMTDKKEWWQGTPIDPFQVLR